MILSTCCHCEVYADYTDEDLDPYCARCRKVCDFIESDIDEISEIEQLEPQLLSFSSHEL